MHKSVKRLMGLLILIVGMLSFSQVASAEISTPVDLYYPGINTVMGNPRGNISVVEFFDYRCHYCKQMPGVLSALIRSNPQVRVVLRDYPALGPSSQFAAQAALAAALQGKYMQMHDALFNSYGPLDESRVMEIARSIGLNTHKLSQDMSSGRVIRQLQNTGNLAQRVGVYGIPTVIVGLTPHGRGSTSAYVLTSPSLGDLQNAIQRLRRE